MVPSIAHLSAGRFSLASAPKPPAGLVELITYIR